MTMTNTIRERFPMKGQLFRKIALAGFIFIVFALLIAFRSRVLVPVAAVHKDQNGICDLNGVDFEKEIAELQSDFDWYGGELLTPEDFESGMTPDPAIYNLTENAAEIPYGTYRIVLKGEADRSYLMTGYSVDYSTRIWCGDEILTEIGKVSSDPGESEPRILYFTVP